MCSSVSDALKGVSSSPARVEHMEHIPVMEHIKHIIKLGELQLAFCVHHGSGLIAKKKGNCSAFLFGSKESADVFAQKTNKQ